MDRTSAELVKETSVTQQLESIKFIIGDSNLITSVSNLNVIQNQLYDKTTSKFISDGLLDTKLGTSNKLINCNTCQKNLEDCVGHFGHIRLYLPVFHVGFFLLTIKTLQCICKNCSSILINKETANKFLSKITFNISYEKRKLLHTNLIKECRKVKNCYKCGYKNGVVKKGKSALQILHSTSLGYNDIALTNFECVIEESSQDIVNLLEQSKFELLNPLDVYILFENINQEDLPLLSIRIKDFTHPKDMIITSLPIPPVCIRPSTTSTFRSGTTEDDLTVQLADIILINNTIQFELKKDEITTVSKVMEHWYILQIYCGLYFNSQMTGIPQELQKIKFTRSLAQRLKGKQGRFRSSLSGKRVNFSSRTVISPDPNLRINEVGIPVEVAKILTFTETVNEHNIELMKQLVKNGNKIHPGAIFIENSKTGLKRNLNYGNLETISQTLRVGDKVERHIKNGDIAIFNRQPSLHKYSLMGHIIKILPGKTFRFNPSACGPYNADFDGDEMNIHIVQTFEAQAEVATLMDVKHNLVTSRCGEPLIAAIQDFITGTYLLTQKDTFFPKVEVDRFISSILDVNTQKRIIIPPPVIIKPLQLWTGKQLIELIINPYKDVNIKLNLITKGRRYTKNEEFCVEDSYIIIKNNILISGVLDKTLLGANSKNNLFYLLMIDFSKDLAIAAMWRLCKIIPTFLSNRGFSIGIEDVKPTINLIKEKNNLIINGNNYICNITNKNLSNEILESQILTKLSDIRDEAGKVCKIELSKNNSALIMAQCGSKGSFINIAQMIACVGQQAINGSRPVTGFGLRTFPHFKLNEIDAAAKGFVSSSFYDGLSPIEFFFHAMGGREGLIDSAVKTAETGYMQRRLVKCLEDLCICYDNTVRNSNKEIIQFVYGDDSIDPSMTEGDKGCVLNFNHLLNHIKNTIPFDKSNELLNLNDMMIFIKSIIKTQNKYNIIPIFGEQIEKFLSNYNTLSNAQIIAFIELCYKRISKAMMEPGTAVGALAATSIGEPSTQMTLKTFHFAGVASMNITQGVPRIKEIVNAVKTISSPLIIGYLTNEVDENFARKIQRRVQQTTLNEIIEYIDVTYLPNDCFVLIKINRKIVKFLDLEINMHSIIVSILNTKLPVPIKFSQISIIGKRTLCIRPLKDTLSVFRYLNYIKYNIGSVIVKGFKHVTKCIIDKDEITNTFKLLINSTNFIDILSTVGIDGKRTIHNNAIDVSQTLGVEAARSCIIKEIVSTMRDHGIELDSRHVMLLADLMTNHGTIIGMTRNGLVKLKESTLLLASFEKTTEHLYNAAFYAQEDIIDGVSDSIIMGVPIKLGTGHFKLLYKQNKVIKQRSSIF